MILSVIVTTYNRPDALAAVLEGLLAQEGAGLLTQASADDSTNAEVSSMSRAAPRAASPSPHFEVLVADDGSAEPTKRLVDSMTQRFRDSIRHVWHADEGFRAGTIRNRAAAVARGELLVFLDGDCIPRPRFVAAHALAATPRCMMRGSRALLSERFTARILAERIPVHAWSARSWVRARARGDVNRLSGLIPMPWSRRVGSPRHEWRSVRTCNLALWRHDFLTLNGFDERFVGWGYEDSDLAIRGLNDGLRVRRAGPASTVLHLWHRENDRRFEGENLARLEATQRSGAVRAERGLAEANTAGTNSIAAGTPRGGLEWRRG